MGADLVKGAAEFCVHAGAVGGCGVGLRRIVGGAGGGGLVAAIELSVAINAVGNGHVAGFDRAVRRAPYERELPGARQCYPRER